MRFNKSHFRTALLIYSALAIMSVIAVAVEDESTAANHPIGFLLARLHDVFRFPSHLLLQDWLDAGGAILFFGGLLFNCSLYALMTERFITLMGGWQQVPE